MNRNNIKRKIHCDTSRFKLNNKEYQKQILRYTFEEMMEDFSKGDVTTQAFFKKDAHAQAVVVMKQHGIIAGLAEIPYFLKKLPKIKAKFLKKDGARVKPGDIVLKLSGPVHELMRTERVMLNFIGRLSGIATYTAKHVALARKINRNILLTPTRKTLWGWLDKKACTVAGAGTHRLNLNDAILIKHNHIKAAGIDIAEYLRKTLKNAHGKKSARGRFIEIEVRNAKDAIKVAKVFTQAKSERRIKQIKLPCFLMFDNMFPQKIARAIEIIKRETTYNSVLFEASGGINLKNLASFVKTGVDIISIGALTHSAAMLDCSMRII